jgi:hypothetical protein
VPTLEVYNKSNVPLKVMVDNGGQRQKLDIEPGKQGQAFIDKSQTTRLTIWAVDDKMDLNEPDMVYDLPKNKNIYLTFGPWWHLREQTGKMKGLIKETASGLTKGNNVKTSDLKKVSYSVRLAQRYAAENIKSDISVGYKKLKIK